MIKIRLTLILAICLAALGLVHPYTVDTEMNPELQWLIETLRAPDTAAREAAARELGKMGSEAKAALPALMKVINGPDPYLGDIAKTALYRIGLPDTETILSLIPDLESPDLQKREDAVLLIRTSSAPEAQEALRQYTLTHLSDLEDMVRNNPDPERRLAGTYLIGLLKEEASPAVPTLISALEDKSPMVRKNAIAVLGRVGPAAAEAASRLIAILDGKFEFDMCRQCAAYALGKIGVPEAAPCLIRALEDEEVGIQLTAVTALGDLGQAGKDAVPQIAEILKAADPDTQKIAKEALKKINTQDARQELRVEARSDADQLFVLLHDLEIHFGDNAQPLLKGLKELLPYLVPDFIAALSNKEWKIRARAIWLLSQLGDKASEALPALIKALDDQHPDVRKNATYALRMMGPMAKKAVPKILELASKDKEICRTCAIQALGKIGDPKVIKPLTKMLVDPDPDVRNQTITTLGEFGHKADKAVPQIIKALKDKHTYIRESASWALGQIAPQEPTVISALIEAVNDEHIQVRSNSFNSLANSNSKRALPVAVKALTDPEQNVRWAASFVLVRLKKDAAPAFPALLKSLNDSKLEVRLNAAYSLKLIENPAAVPALMKALNDPEQKMQVEAVFALGAFHCKAKQAVQPLIKLTDDSERDLRLAAIRVLGNLGYNTPEVTLSLKKARTNKDVWIRLYAMESLWKLGSSDNPEQVILAVKAMTKSDNRELVEYAQNMLERLRNEKPALCVKNSTSQ